jgi:hypothetical protein
MEVIALTHKAKVDEDTLAHQQQMEEMRQQRVSFHLLVVLIKFLLSNAPPLSAFIDYLVSVIQKNNANSLQEFFKVLFRARNKNDVEIHDASKDEMIGDEMKDLYEKFCYLHGYLEKPLDDKESS